MLVARIRPRANSNAQATSLCGSRSSNIRPFLEKSLMDLRFNRVGAVAASMLLVVVALVGASALSSNPLGPSTLPPGGAVREQATNNFDQLVVVLMENKNLDEVYGPAAYMTQLADLYSFSEGWASITNPSQPNYIAILGGSTFGVSDDGNQLNLNHPTMVDILENTSKTWKAFAEDASGSGCSLNPPRGEDHFPFLSYTTITNNSARCANLLPGSYNEVITAFNAGTNFIWLTPNACNNMHSCSVATGDAWIQSWVPNLLLAMAGKKAALIIMFDEAYTSPPDIYMSFSGPAAKLAYKSTASYTHYSLLKLIEDVWGGGSLGQGDVTAPSPLEFFNSGGPDFALTATPDFSISATPANVAFVADQSATSTISLTSTGGFTGAVALTAASAPPGVTASCAPSTISGSQTSTCNLASSTSGTYTVTVTGTNGSLVHTTSISVTVTAPANPDFSITADPNTLAFVSGQTAFSTISLQSIGGFNGAVSLSGASSTAGMTTSCAHASISGTQPSVCTMGGTAFGSYTVVVTGQTGTVSHTASIAVTVAATGPAARFTFTPPYPKVNNSVSFDASSSTDSDPRATLQARWDWEGDGIWDTPWSSSLTIQHVFTTAGAYLVKLGILDSNGLTAGLGQWLAVQSPGGGDKTPPQVSILSPSNDTVIASANVTVSGVAWDNVEVSAIELSTDNTTWTPTSGTTSWSGSVLLNEGMNHIYARAIDTSGNAWTAVITVIANHANPGVTTASLADPTVPILIAISPVVALAAIHASLRNRTKTPRKQGKKQTAVVGQSKKR